MGEIPFAGSQVIETIHSELNASTNYKLLVLAKKPHV
jgi:hypothetical protein